MFNDLLESSSSRRKSKPGSFLVSMAAHMGLLAGLIAIPLIYYDVIPEVYFVQPVSAMALPPKPKPPQPPSAAAPPEASQPAVQEVRLAPDTLMAPTEVPDEIPAPDEHLPVLSEWLTHETIGSSAVPGGGIVGAGGSALPAGLIDSGAAPVPPPPPPPRKRKEIRQVGGSVLGAQLIRKVEPRYPDLARRARVRGAVYLRIVVDREGKVRDAKVVRGHKLLSDAALRAVRQWRYTPTLLNGEPVEVTAVITVHFRMH